MTLKEIRHTYLAIEILGGDKAVAKLIKSNPKAVTNWRYFNEFPPKAAFRIQRELNLRGYYIRPALLGQRGCEKLQLSRIS